MVDVTELKRTADEVRRVAMKGQDSFSARYIVAQLVLPLLELLRTMQAMDGRRWLTLTEAQKASGRKRNYFEKKLALFGGRCRLEVWMEEGFADRTDDGEGPWLISPVKVDESKLGDTETPTERDDHLPGSDDLASAFLKAS